MNNLQVALVDFFKDSFTFKLKYAMSLVRDTLLALNQLLQDRIINSSKLKHQRIAEKLTIDKILESKIDNKNKLMEDVAKELDDGFIQNLLVRIEKKINQI